ncbi:protein ref(2)P [Uranotaenia lowii]|uniref:protein ref(2)P n=1 Tax=Uranotaenia lowii TaxID=190385 RepID=UPI00247A6A6C|nr:protein ref(2)P [Uranotaenia lowii]
MASNNHMKITVLRSSGSTENFLLNMALQHEVGVNFVNLKNEIVARYPELLQNDEIRFYWIDEEGDEITIINDSDYLDYLKPTVLPVPSYPITRDTFGRVLLNNPPAPIPPVRTKLRIYVKGVNNPKAATEPIATTAEDVPMETASVADSGESKRALPENAPEHPNVICDVCDDTIKGHRYKCMQCFNYDLCMRCEAKYRHKDHMMLRIPTPEMNKRTPLRLFDKLRSYVTEVSAANAAGCRARDEDYENSKRSKRHHSRPSSSKDYDDSKERREDKERKERKHRRERSAKAADDRRSSTHRSSHHFNLSHLLGQAIDPANIKSAFLATDIAAAAAAAAAESAQEAARVTFANCPLFSSSSTSTANQSCSNTTRSTHATTTATSSKVDMPQEASCSSEQQEEPKAKKAASSCSDSNNSPVVDLSWLAPTPESIQRINMTFSKILDPLGMNLEIRSNNSSPMSAQQTQTPQEEKQDKTTETSSTPTTSTPSQTAPNDTKATETSNKSTEIDPIQELEKRLEAALLVEQSNTKSSKNDDDSDDDDDDSTSSESSGFSLCDEDDPLKTTKRWTLVDIPNDDDADKKKPTVVQVDIAVTTPKSDDTPVTPKSVPEAASSSSSINSQNISIDYEQLGKILKQHIETEMEATSKQSPSSSTQAPSTPKDATPPSAAVTVVEPSVSTPSTTTVPAPQESSSQPPVPATHIFSNRPHVNHAVHSMMAMGFSNTGGWLTQLLDSVNGDIPRALDILQPHKIIP